MAAKKRTRREPILSVRKITPFGDLVLVKPDKFVKPDQRRGLRRRRAVGVGTVVASLVSGFRREDSEQLMPKLKKGDRVAYRVWGSPECMEVGGDLVYTLRAEDLIGKVVD